MATAESRTASEEYLFRRLALLQRRVAHAVAARQRTDPEPEDRFRGLYVSREQAERLFESRGSLHSGFDTSDNDALETWAEEQEAGGEPVRFRAVCRAFALTRLDADILMIALGPDLDPRLERAYGYLHDDVTRRRASIGLAIELCGGDVMHAATRARLAPGAPLAAGGLVHIEDLERPYLTRSLRVPDVVTGRLLGEAVVDARIAAVAATAVPAAGYDPAPILRALNGGIRLVYLRDKPGTAALSYAAEAVRVLGRPMLAIDLKRLSSGDGATLVAQAAVRQARMEGGVLVADGVDELAEYGLDAVRAFAEADVDVILIGPRAWDPRWSREAPLCLDAPPILDPLDPRLSYRLTPEQADRARRAAAHKATAMGVEPDLSLLSAGVREQNAAALDRLAVRVAPAVGWDDLVLPSGVAGQLHELLARVRHRHLVLTEWGMRRRSGKGLGVTALFSGESGTGKTLAAEVVAGELGLDLYVIDLSTVVDKYIGETEKNLDRIFREADQVNGVLLFDEADAIFGKRSEVQDARDRYANIEISYLLQRMESFDGTAILTTNLRSNIDKAFIRRLDAVLEFPVPDEPLRLRIWERHLPAALPRDDSVDLGFLARSFALPGGNIRNVALTAAFLAASDDRPVSMAMLVQAMASEYRKLGRLCSEREFGPYFDLVSEDVGSRKLH